MNKVIMHQKTDGAEASVSLPHLSVGEQLYITNIGRIALGVSPKGHEPIPPGETRLFERVHPNGGIVVTKNVADVPPENFPKPRS